MAKRILPILCALLFSIALVGLVLGGAAKATLLNEKAANQAITQSGYAVGQTLKIQQTIAGFFEGAGLDGELAAVAVSEEAVDAAIGYSLGDLLNGGTGTIDASGMFSALGEGTIAGLEAEGGTITDEGLTHIAELVELSEHVFAEMTVAPMAGVLNRLSGLLGAGGGIASIILCAALAVLALVGVAFTARGEGGMGLYLSSGLLGAGLAMLLPALLLDDGRAALTGVMTRYYEGFYNALVLVGAVFAVAGLVLIVARLVAGRKKA